MTFRSAALAVVSTAALLTGAAALAQAEADPDATAQGDVSVTIYNNGLGLVQDVRQLAIPQGRSTISFPDVSAQIRPETLSFAAEGTGIVEQNFDFDLLTPQKLMEKAIGQTVTLVRTNPATGQETREPPPTLGLPATSSVSAEWNVVPVPLVSVTQPCMSIVPLASS